MDRKLLAVDAACLLVYLVAASPALTGIGIHEWLGLGVLVVFFAHAAMHVDWAVEAVRSAFARPSWARTGNLALDLLIVAAFMTVTVSGISRQHIPKSGRSSSEPTDTCSLRLRDLMALRVRSWGIRGSLRPCRKSSHGSMTFDAGGIFNGRFPGFVSVAPWLRPGFVGSS